MTPRGYVPSAFELNLKPHRYLCDRIDAYGHTCFYGAMKDLLPDDDDLRPSHTPLGVDQESQAESMRELRALENAGRAARWLRDDRLVALAMSNSLSRPDMARSIGMSRPRVDQLIADHYKRLQDERTAELLARAVRHFPQGWHQA
jgi:hypothetical protein